MPQSPPNTPKNRQETQLTIREHHEVKNGKGYSSFLVQGWKENGKWKRKKFKNRKDAERFVALKVVELQNEGRSQRMVLSPLTDEQIQEAVEAFDQLGKTYSLKQAVTFFLENHREPGFTIKMGEAYKIYLEERASEGVRARTLIQSKSVLKQFVEAYDDPYVHQVTSQTLQSFLKSLRAKDGISPAKRKTWNNYRNELNHFFSWSGKQDLRTKRPWTFVNPVEDVHVFTAKQVAEQRPEVATTSVEDVEKIFSTLMRWRGGVLVKCFALAYFAGIRPDGEMKRLSPREKELINLATGMIKIPANVSKTKEARLVTVTENLSKWLKAYPDTPIIPKNFDRLMKQARKHFGLSHDETRHSFISYHVALNRSVGDAALQAGNSEAIVKKHYLNLYPSEEGHKFFEIIPDLKRRRAVSS